MKRIIFIICCLCTIGVSAQEKKKIVVATIRDTTKISEDMSGMIIDACESGLKKANKYEVIPNNKDFIAMVNETEEIQNLGLIDDSQQIEFGKAKNAEIIFVATIREIDGNFKITCKFMDVGKRENIGQTFSFETTNGRKGLMEVTHLIERRIATGRDLTVERAEWVTAPKCYYDESSDKYVDCDISISDEESRTYTEACEFCKNKGEGWRLPTKEELAMIYRNRLKIETTGVRFKTKDYWSSSKRNNYESYVINFGAGTLDCYSKNIKNPFRCIRYY
ncbi:MAG: DUF1566 domain-containing protein [Prevotellaceae bacterium]|jgi:hypothetical protein|nr:DUF1566 domain-containing protein [Prevotellaceae bacterium]